MGEHDDATIDRILAELVDQQLSGGQPNVEAAVAECPEHAEEIRARYDDLKKLTSLWQKLSTHASGRAKRGPTISAGTSLGEYVIVRELGHGGMGTVYLARQESLDRMVAVKVVPEAANLSAATRERFLREARALAGVSHPNIVPVYSAGQDQGVMYIAMEYVEGVSLADLVSAVRGREDSKTASDVWDALVDAGPMRPANAPSPDQSTPPDLAVDTEYLQTCLQAACDVAGALAAAHRKGIVHRDVKPANIIIDASGRAQLLDFGLASVLTEPMVTVTGEFFGTPNYVSPEQAGGRRDAIGVHTDVYSLGATLYECLTLAPPFDGDSVGEVLSHVLHDEPLPLRKINPSCARELETVVMKALSKDPANRYASMTELSDDLQRVLKTQPITARGPSVRKRLTKRVRRSPLAAAIVAIIASALIGAAAVLAWPYLTRSTSPTDNPPATDGPGNVNTGHVGPVGGGGQAAIPPDRAAQVIDPPQGQTPAATQPTDGRQTTPQPTDDQPLLTAQDIERLITDRADGPDGGPVIDTAELNSVRSNALAAMNIPVALKWMETHGMAAHPLYARYTRMKGLRVFLATYLANCSPDDPLTVTLRDNEGAFDVKVYTATEDAALVLVSDDQKVRTTFDELEPPVRARILLRAVGKGTPLTSPLRQAADLFVTECRDVGLLPADFR